MRSIIFSWSLGLYALFFSMTSYAQQQVPSLGEFSDTLMKGPVTAFLSFLEETFYLVGAGLIIVGIHKFFVHRKNPHMAPFGTVIVYIILGIICVLLPFTKHLLQAPLTP